MMAPAVRLTEGYLISFLHTWRGQVFRSVLQPLFYVVAFGFGVGTLVEEGARTVPGLGMPYVEWMVPGLVVALSFQLGAFTGGTQIVVGFVWEHTFRLALTAPLAVIDIAVSLVLWSVARALLIVVPLLLLFVGLGTVGLSAAAVTLLWSLLAAALGAVLLSGLGAGCEGTQWLTISNKFVVLPLVLLSGSVFPLDQFPDPVARVLSLLPVGTLIAAARGSVGMDDLPWLSAPVALAWVVLGVVVLLRRLRTRAEG